MKKSIKIIICILAIMLVIAIIIFGTLKIKNIKKEEKSNINRRKIINIEKIKDNNRIYYINIYSDGSIENYDNEEENKKISEKNVNELIELIDKVDESKCRKIMTDEAVTSGTIIKIYDSKNKEIIIKDFYRTNITEEADRIFEILNENDLY